MVNNTDEKILKAFDQLVIKRGYQGTTTKEIAVAAGVNESTVFRHFPSKEDILKAELKRSMENIEEIVAGFQATDNLENDIERMGRKYVQYVQHHQAIFLTGIRDSYLYPQIRDAIQKLPSRMMELLAKRFKDDYGIDINDQIKYSLQNLFLILFGRMTMKLTYPQSKLLSSDRDFINQNFKSLVHYCVQQVMTFKQN